MLPLSQEELNARITQDFSKQRTDIVEYIRRFYPQVTDTMLASWEASGALECLEIDGEKRYFKNAAKNLFRIDAAARALRTARYGPEHAARSRFLSQYIPQLLASATSKDFKSYCRTYTATFALDVRPDVVSAGTIVRCWLPFPRTDCCTQNDVQLLHTNSTDYVIAPSDSCHQSIYIEQRARRGQPTHFEMQCRFTARPEVMMQLNNQGCTELNDLQEFLQEEMPHIRFTDAIRRINEEIVGTEGDPHKIAERIFVWISTNIPWASAREYSTIANIPEYVLRQRHGDCGQKTLLLITLCRLNGIPARWQSGFMLHPGNRNLHDWAELWFADTGWVSVDVSFGVQSWGRNRQERLFYLGSRDAFRWIVNRGICGELFPKKCYERSETVDFQRGEVEWRGGNLYFDQWNYRFNIKQNR